MLECRNNDMPDYAINTAMAMKMPIKLFLLHERDEESQWNTYGEINIVYVCMCVSVCVCVCVCV